MVAVLAIDVGVAVGGVEGAVGDTALEIDFEPAEWCVVSAVFEVDLLLGTCGPDRVEVD